MFLKQGKIVTQSKNSMYKGHLCFKEIINLKKQISSIGAA